MKNRIKALIGAAAVLALLAIATPLAASSLQERRMHRHVDVPPAPVSVPSDATSLERGRYLFSSRGCAHCHGADGRGRVFVDEAGGLRAKSPNISSGPGSVVHDYRTADWDHTIRHGVKPDGTPVFIMPSDDYNRLSNDDVGALIAYLKALPPVSGSGAAFRLPLAVKLLYGTGLIDDAAARIDHSLGWPETVASTVSVENGRYVAAMCMGCHGPNLSGGRIPGTPPSWPPAANLTPGPGSALARYENADAFIAMLRSGRRPDGSAVSSVMPFDALTQLSETDARAVYAFLRRLPPRPEGHR